MLKIGFDYHCYYTSGVNGLKTAQVRLSSTGHGEVMTFGLMYRG